MLFDKDGYLKSGLSEDVVRTVVQRYAEQEETKKLQRSNCSNCGGDKKIRCDDAECATCASDAYCGDSLACKHCVITHFADTTDYCILPTACERGVISLPQDIKWSCRRADVTCKNCLLALNAEALATLNTIIATTEEEEVERLLSMVDLGEGEKEEKERISAIAPTQKQYHANGMVCKGCSIPNKYVTESNQLDGSYLCWSCRTGF